MIGISIWSPPNYLRKPKLIDFLKKKKIRDNAGARGTFEGETPILAQILMFVLMLNQS